MAAVDHVLRYKISAAIRMYTETDLTYQEVANVFGISKNTVGNHVRKLRLRDRFMYLGDDYIAYKLREA